MARTLAVQFGLVIAAFGALLSFVIAVSEPTFTNLFWQITDGLAILRDGRLPTSIASAIESGPLLSHEWLFELGAGFAAAHGSYAAIVLACALAAAATPVLVYALARAYGCSAFSAGIVGILAAGARFVGSSLRPETFAVDLFALQLLVVARALPVWCALPISAVWANVHASAALAVAVPAVMTLGAAFSDGARSARVRRYAAVTLLSIFGTLVTPYGLQLWAYVWEHAVLPDPTLAVAATWAALSFSSFGAWTAVLPGMLVLALHGLVLQRRYVPELLPAALLFAATVLHERYAVFLVVAWAVAMARTLDTDTMIQRLDLRHYSSAPLLLATFAIAAIVMLPRVQTVPAPLRSATAAADIAAKYNLSGNAYVDIVWASYLVYRGLPLRPLVDGHDAYPASVWNDTRALAHLTRGWDAALERRKIGVVIVKDGDPLAQTLAGHAGWRTLERRDGVVVFERAEDLRRT